MSGTTPAPFPAEYVALGVFDNHAGGVLLRFGSHKQDELSIALTGLLVGVLMDRLEAAKPKFESDELNDQPAAVVPAAERDFSDIAPGNSVTRIGTATRAREFLLEVHLVSGNIRRIAVPRGIALELLRNLVHCFEELKLLDVRRWAGQSWHEIASALERHPGVRVRARLDGFDFSIESFRRNTKSLVAALEPATGVLSDEVSDWTARFQIDRMLFDAMHHLFNFVASTKALVDHSRFLYEQEYEKKGLLPEYPNEIEARFKNDGLVDFVHALRNVLLHIGHVGLTHVKRFGSAGIIGTFVVPSEPLLEWRKLPAAARAWILSAPATINLLDVVHGYAQKVEDFHKWFYRARENVHWRETREAELLRRLALATRGQALFPEVRTLIDNNARPAVIQRTMSEMLTSEQEFILRPYARESARWFTEAIAYIKPTCFIPSDIEVALTNYGNPPSDGTVS